MPTVRYALIAALAALAAAAPLVTPEPSMHAKKVGSHSHPGDAKKAASSGEAVKPEQDAHRKFGYDYVYTYSKRGETADKAAEAATDDKNGEKGPAGSDYIYKWSKRGKAAGKAAEAIKLEEVEPLSLNYIH